MLLPAANQANKQHIQIEFDPYSKYVIKQKGTASELVFSLAVPFLVHVHFGSLDTSRANGLSSSLRMNAHPMSGNAPRAMISQINTC